MAEFVCRDLQELGLRFIKPDDPEFAPAAAGIRERTRFPPLLDEAPDFSALLTNESGQTVIGFTVLWSFTNSLGQTSRMELSNLGPGMEALAGRSLAMPAAGVAPGSKRLITTQGIFGNNADVVPPDPRFPGFRAGSGGFSGSRRLSIEGELQFVELTLDLMVFADGLVAGPDIEDKFPEIQRDLDEQRALIGRLAAAMRDGASPGRVFEMLLPYVRELRGNLEARPRP